MLPCIEPPQNPQCQCKSVSAASLEWRGDESKRKRGVPVSHQCAINMLLYSDRERWQIVTINVLFQMARTAKSYISTAVSQPVAVIPYGFGDPQRRDR